MHDYFQQFIGIIEPDKIINKLYKRAYEIVSDEKVRRQYLSIDKTNHDIEGEEEEDYPDTFALSNDKRAALSEFQNQSSEYVKKLRNNPPNSSRINILYKTVGLWSVDLQSEFDLFCQFWSEVKSLQEEQEPLFNFNIRLILRYLSYRLSIASPSSDILKKYILYVNFKAIIHCNDLLVHEKLNFILDNIEYIMNLKSKMDSTLFELNRPIGYKFGSWVSHDGGVKFNWSRDPMELVCLLFQLIDEKDDLEFKSNKTSPQKAAAISEKFLIKGKVIVVDNLRRTFDQYKDNYNSFVDLPYEIDVAKDVIINILEQ
jgi:hypothetical protein